MTTVPAVAERLSRCRNREELGGALRELCTPFGKVIAVTLLCSGTTPETGMCVIDFDERSESASQCALMLGGRIFGYNAVALSFPRHAEFGCGRGFPPATPSCACNPSA